MSLIYHHCGCSILIPVRIPCNRAEEAGSLRAFLVLFDWQVKVFGLSGIIDRPSERLYLRTNPLSGCMYIRSHYKYHYQGYDV